MKGGGANGSFTGIDGSLTLPPAVAAAAVATATATILLVHCQLRSGGKWKT